MIILLGVLILQRQVVMMSASFVIADAGAGLAGSSPGRPVHDMGDDARQRGGDPVEQPPDLVDGQGNQWFAVAVDGSPFLTASRVITRNAAASMDNVMCRYQGS